MVRFLKQWPMHWKHYKSWYVLPQLTKVLETTTAVLAKVTFNNLQTVKTRINGHDEDWDILDQALQDFWKRQIRNFERQQWH